MKYVIDLINTGYLKDGLLIINTEQNEVGYPDGTVFSITAYDNSGNNIGTKQFDFAKLFGQED